MTNARSSSAQSAPLVSVITPFYNTERYLAECIESVLAQTYQNWEYILVNNQSTDSSRHIAESYSRKDSRLRLLDTPRHLSQMDNFEAALRYMTPESRYCKMVLADDWILPECIERMVALAEANSSVGIVSSYRFFGNEITGDGLPHSSSVVPGREACRLMLVDGRYLTGSPTSILVRSDIVRTMHPFYPVGWIHEDTEACFRILADHDLGFIHEVLSFSRTDNDSLRSDVARFHPGPIRKFMFAKQYGPQFLGETESREYLRRATDFYGQFLAQSVFELKDKEFWDFQRRGLAVVGSSFASIGLPKYILLEILDIVFNPKKTAGRLVRMLKSSRKTSIDSANAVQPERVQITSKPSKG
jgi:glycosyltransferase involved in cell wall biosynthesis